MGPNRTLGEPLWKALPIESPLLRASAGVITFEQILYQIWMGFYLHTQVSLASKTSAFKSSTK